MFPASVTNIILAIPFAAAVFLSQLPVRAAEPGAADKLRAASAFKGWKLDKFEIKGPEKPLASALKKGLAIPSLFSRIPGRKPAFYPPVLLDDLNRTTLFMARRGYPNATVNVVFDPHPTEKKLSLIMEVVPGAPVRIAEVSLEGFPPPLEREAHRTLGIKAGSVFTENGAEETAVSLERQLKLAGYAHARLNREILRIDSTSVGVLFKADPGGAYRFGDTGVTVAHPDLAPLVRKTVSIKKGTSYSPLALERARQNLRLLDLFRKIVVGTVDAGVDTLDVAVDLTPRKFRTFEFGVGYWTDGQLYTRAAWIHRNLFRAGRGLSIDGYLSLYLQSAKVSCWWPSLVTSRTKESISAKIESHREDSYDLLSTGGELVSVYRHSNTAATRTSVEVSNVDVTVKTDAVDAFLETGGLLSVFAFRWTRNTTDDRLSPTQGTSSWFKTEWAPNGFLSHSHFASFEASGAAYFPLISTAVLAARLTVGVAEPTGGSPDLLPNKRFFSGGANSMRGFERRKLGPLDTEGAPLGGEVKLETSVELRARLVWRFQYALFVDAGQVWRRLDNVDVNDLEVAVGPGLMIRTPVGPIRADVGRRLTDRERTQPDWVFHLTVGHSF